MCHLDHHPKFPTKVIGCAIWILILLEAARTPNESNQNPMPNHQVRGDPYWSIKKRSTKLISECQDCHHAVVKEAEHLRVQELVRRIENHPDREAFHADLQQNNVYNPFSKHSKEMIRELGNVELFELCETTPKVQCSHCLLYWNQGIVHFTCGQCLIDSESRRKFNKLRLDALSFPNYVIKKGPAYGARHGKAEEQKRIP